MQPLEIAVAKKWISAKVEHGSLLLLSHFSRWQSDTGTVQFDDLVGVEIHSDQLVLLGEGVGVYPGDQVVIEGDGLDLVRDGLGSDRRQLVEGDVHRQDVQFIFLIKIVAYLFNFVLMNIQPVQRP